MSSQSNIAADQLDRADRARRSTLTWRGQTIPFLMVHAACALVLVTGAPRSAVLVCLATFSLRAFGITAGYHRYFAHRAYKTGRVFQFILAVLGTASIQKGVLWWAGHHRMHHRFTDLEGDPHSPVRDGFLWSHVGWFLADDYEGTNWERIRDFSKFPELVWLNAHFLVPPLALAIGLYLLGGLPWLVWGFFVSTVLVWHITFAINSLAHRFGSRRYETADDSRNSMLLALLSLGEGWHNNHHHFMNSARQGFFWWEIDVTYYVLWILARFGIVRDLIQPPARLYGAER